MMEREQFVSGMDGRWEYRISLGLVEGKYKYKSFYAKSEKELKKLIKQYQENRKKICNGSWQKRHYRYMPGNG